MNYYIVSIIIVTVLLIGFIGVLLYSIYLSRLPYCGGYVNPTIIYCSNKGQSITEDSNYESSCNPEEREFYNANLFKFLDYIFAIYKKSSRSLFNEIHELFPKNKLYQGIFYFAIPELLKIIPTDFGQNYSTPYGLISFFNDFASCVSQSTSFCNNLFSNSAEKAICLEYFNKKAKEQDCPFPISDSNNNLYIDDRYFFNQIGLLGALSLFPFQAIIIQCRLPVAELKLNYWSFNVYIIDNLKKTDICYPFRQTIAASISPPLNMFNSVAISGKKFNPLTGIGDLLESGFINFKIVISYNQILSKDIVNKLKEQKNCDFVHSFNIPTSVGSLPIQQNLPNPNKDNNENRLIDPKSQRIGVFFRLSQDPNQIDQKAIDNILYDESGTYFQTCIIEDKSNLFIPFSKLELPPMINPPFNEMQHRNQEFTSIQYKIKRDLFSNLYKNYNLKTRNSLLNIMAPLYPEIIKTKLPYKGGYQAIQMAGNAQADNYDAQYRLSSSTCLSNQDVMVGFAVNHAYFNNSLYNSINIVDISKAYGFNAATLNNKNDYTYYVVLTSRNMQEMNRVSNIIKNTLQSNFKKIQIKIFEIYIPTEPTITDGIPMCHKISMVERVYINTRYISVTNKDLCYSVEDLFGKHFDMLNDEIKITEDAWESLINVVGPSIQQYIPPIYFKTTYYPYFLRNWIIIVICFLSIILFFCTIHIIFFKKKEIKKNK